MPPLASHASVPRRAPHKVRRIGCISYLNARPLIDDLDDRPDPLVNFDVPSRLLEQLVTGQTDISLCPVIDYYRSRLPLEVVPVGGISSLGATLTVRLYSRVPIDRITRIDADGDSHTSVALLRVLMDQMHGLRPELVEYQARQPGAAHAADDLPQAMLLIGDKVIADAPDAATYRHQLDLGQGWYALTGLPFVFAVWMTLQGSDLGDLPATLAAQRRRNRQRLDAIADRHAPGRRWPQTLARRYLSRIMRYTIGPAELEALERFAAMAHRLGLIDHVSPLRLRQ